MYNRVYYTIIWRYVSRLHVNRSLNIWMNSSIPSLVVHWELRDDVMAVLAWLITHSIDSKHCPLEVLTGCSRGSTDVCEVVIENSAVGMHHWQIRVLVEDVANVVMSLGQVWMEVVR